MAGAAGGVIWVPVHVPYCGLTSTDARRAKASHWGVMLVAACLAATLALVPLASSPWARVVLAGVSMAGGGGMYVIGTADLMRRVPAELVATAGGLSAAVQSVVQIIVSPILGRVLDRSHAWSGALIVLGALTIPGALAFAALPATQRGEA